MEPLSLFAIVKKIPSQVYAWLGILIILTGSHWYVYHRGQDNIQTKWEASIERGKTLVDKLKQEQGHIEVQVVTKYVDRVKVIHEKGETIEKLIPQYIPISTPDLPGGFRVLHDAAATNTVPSPSAGVGAQPVPVADVAKVLNFNYELCHAERAKLDSLWEWATRQRQAYLKLCKERGVTCN